MGKAPAASSVWRTCLPIDLIHCMMHLQKQQAVWILRWHTAPSYRNKYSATAACVSTAGLLQDTPEHSHTVPGTSYCWPPVKAPMYSLPHLSQQLFVIAGQPSFFMCIWVQDSLQGGGTSSIYYVCVSGGVARSQMTSSVLKHIKDCVGLASKHVGVSMPSR